MKPTSKKIVFLSLVSCLLLLVANSAFAAQLSIISQTPEINIGSQSQIDVFLDAGGEEINAVEGKIVFPSDLLEVKEIYDGDSIINFWIERPKAETRKDTNMNTNRHEIVFSGVIPGGFEGVYIPNEPGLRAGKLFGVVFAAKKAGTGDLTFQEARVLLNDGKGTEAKLKIFNFQFSIFKEAPISELQIPVDNEPPEEFRAEISRSPEIFKGKWFLVFTAQDKGSGIAYYAIRETRREIKSGTDAKWVEAESPYLLKDQKLKSYIYVKAIDKAGNERITFVEPKYPLQWWEDWVFWSIIILVIIFLYIVIKRKWRKQI